MESDIDLKTTWHSIDVWHI